MRAAHIQYDRGSDIIIQSQIRMNTELSWGEKVFFSELKNICSKNRCYYQPKALGEQFQVSAVTIASWVKKLANAGLLEIATDLNDPTCKQYIRLIEKAA